jgi:hypothetical protein
MSDSRFFNCALAQRWMSTMNGLCCTTALIISLTSIGYARAAKNGAAVDELEKPRLAALEVIERSLQKEISATDADAQTGRLQAAAIDVLTLAKENRDVQSVLAPVLKEAPQRASFHFAKRLQGALSQARDILAFQPVIEAPLPQGFPQWTPVGEIRVQRYPIYRSARTALSDGEDAAFWTLFEHINSNSIAMTAPVEMSYTHTGAEKPRGTAMAFLYSNSNVGDTGSAGKIAVADAPATTAVSIGVRGEITPEIVAEAHERLKAWLADHVDEFKAAGDLRVLGYNSPMIPVEKRYFEVQKPVREIKKDQ